MAPELWKIGDLAARTGLTVRTLHHYDEIGLLRPGIRSTGEHRVYDARDLARLERILVLRSLGLELAEIRECLAQPGRAPLELLRRRLEELRARVAEQQVLVRRLEALDARLEVPEEASLDDVIETIEVLTMFEKYYTSEQLEQLQRRADALGPETIRAVQEEWPTLIAAMQAEMQRGTDPADARVQALARRWSELVAMFTGGDAGIARSLGKLYQGEPATREQHGLDAGLMTYVGRAQASSKRS